ncbi:winged helix-turn-helix transcriptional regulator [Streptomyces sp. H27-D2]|uniref:winged helix-turn-helix transcriptional regulator n=1 Tax=Streptomyces sp. H27-D2 TaxID=3046304 RepID=UPI002DBB9987|nr:helix-turn-helix domain-containing protein [Streptomyces sp. H27-D2]MEC4018822.1 helix-turn-helix domain-containing protein [Streptomyces sp. H27-D2]
MAMACSTGRHAQHDVYAALCPCRDVLDMLANKWAALAIGALEDGPQRFGVLRRRLQGISPKVLTSTLRRLEQNGFVERTVYPAVPLHVEYELTELGSGVSVPLGQLRAWVENHLDGIRAADADAPSCG